MAKILIYGFEKFDKLENNPSAEVGKMIYDSIKKKKGVEARLEIFGVSYDFKFNLEKAIKEFKPDFILGLGASKRNRVSVEKIALNVIHENKPDNKGVVLMHKEIGGKDVGLKTGFDCEKLVNYLVDKNIPCELSYFAGTYICNNAYFNCLKFIKDDFLKTETVFIHVPLSPNEINKLNADAPSFPPHLIADALAAFLESYKKQ